MPAYFYLGVAILAEVVATSMLKATDGFSRLGPGLVVAVSYATAFYCLSLTVRSIPMGLAYAIWSGVGTVLISLIGWVAYHQGLDAPALVGIALILAGVLVIHLFSAAM